MLLQKEHIQYGICAFVVCRDFCSCTTLFLFMKLFDSLIIACRNCVLYSLIGIRLPSLPMSNLKSHISAFDCFFVFSLQLDLI